MRHLIVMRHAKSSWSDPGQRDHDRPLNKRGRRGATLVGTWLKQQGIRPDRALVSSARRTQESWAGVVAEIGPAETSYVADLYHAGPETMLDLVRQVGASAGSVLVLGHNPGIAAFAQRLLAEQPDDPDYQRFPTAATAVIEFDGPGWQDLAWGSGRLSGFVVPRVLE
jgi:phosphohistidine phosphatase